MIFFFGWKLVMILLIYYEGKRSLTKNLGEKKQ